MMMAPECAVDTAPTPKPSRAFQLAADWLRINADKHAVGSRDFGRGFMHAAAVLQDQALTGTNYEQRRNLALSLLNHRKPSEDLCRLVIAVMEGVDIEALIAMEAID